VRAWNADVALGRDSVYEKQAETLYPIVAPPYYAVELRPAIIGKTFPGIRIDEHARVLDRVGEPIPNLFAAGEITGGLAGAIYPGGGVSVGKAVAFGRIAGRSAAQ
jgi:fumarate reductase flavoprotein subunit